MSYMDFDFKDLSKESYNFVKGLLKVDVTKRLTPTQALSHKWILQEEVKDTVINDK